MAVASSAGRSASGGGWYVSHHQSAHTRPAAPQATKTQRQEPCSRIAAIAGGATTAPTAVPALTRPMAVARSAAGNHSAITFVAAGNPPPSPAPSRKRLSASMPTPVARLWLAQAIDQNIMMRKNPRRVPSRSTSAPPPAYISA